MGQDIVTEARLVVVQTPVAVPGIGLVVDGDLFLVVDEDPQENKSEEHLCEEVSQTFDRQKLTLASKYNDWFKRRRRYHAVHRPTGRRVALADCSALDAAFDDFRPRLCL